MQLVLVEGVLHRRLHRRLVFADLLLLTLAAAAVVRLVGFAFFPGFTAFATLPVSEDHTRHACFSAYYLAVDRAARGEPVYPPEAYTQAEGAIGGIPVESVNVDAFVYPPLFLPTMEPFAGLDFGLARGLWMLANLLVLGPFLVARWSWARTWAKHAADEGRPLSTASRLGLAIAYFVVAAASVLVTAASVFMAAHGPWDFFTPPLLTVPTVPYPGGLYVPAARL